MKFMLREYRVIGKKDFGWFWNGWEGPPISEWKDGWMDNVNISYGTVLA
jgi:hypothetical protein